MTRRRSVKILSASKKERGLKSQRGRRVEENEEDERKRESTRRSG